ncbi:Uma2 family endonuclease [Lachnospiraceae bacterium ZAX-1]
MIHQKILGYLYNAVYNHIPSRNGSCEILPSTFAFKLNKDDKTTVKSDIFVLCDKGKLNNRGFHGAPAWIIEITSPSTSEHDYITKAALYKTASVREYWIVDHQNQLIAVDFFGSGSFFPQHDDFTNAIKANIYDD